MPVAVVWAILNGTIIVLKAFVTLANSSVAASVVRARVRA